MRRPIIIVAWIVGSILAWWCCVIFVLGNLLVPNHIALLNSLSSAGTSIVPVIVAVLALTGKLPGTVRGSSPAANTDALLVLFRRLRIIVGSALLCLGLPGVLVGLVVIYYDHSDTPPPSDVITGCVLYCLMYKHGVPGLFWSIFWGSGALAAVGLILGATGLRRSAVDSRAAAAEAQVSRLSEELAKLKGENPKKETGT